MQHPICTIPTEEACAYAANLIRVTVPKKNKMVNAVAVEKIHSIIKPAFSDIQVVFTLAANNLLPWPLICLCSLMTARILQSV